MPDFAPYEPASKHSTTPVRAVVRHVSRDDLDALSRFRLAAVSRTRDDWAGMIEKSVAGDRLLLVADADDKVVAFAQAHRLEEWTDGLGPAGHYLTGVTVQPAYRRSGLGRQFTAMRLAWIRERSDEAWYFANPDNRSSIRLHQEFGFAEVGRAPVIHGVDFSSEGAGVLFRLDLRGDGTRSIVNQR